MANTTAKSPPVGWNKLKDASQVSSKASRQAGLDPSNVEMQQLILAMSFMVQNYTNTLRGDSRDQYVRNKIGWIKQEVYDLFEKYGLTNLNSIVDEVFQNASEELSNEQVLELLTELKLKLIDLRVAQQSEAAQIHDRLEKLKEKYTDTLKVNNKRYEETSTQAQKGLDKIQRFQKTSLTICNTHFDKMRKNIDEASSSKTQIIKSIGIGSIGIIGSMFSVARTAIGYSIKILKSAFSILTSAVNGVIKFFNKSWFAKFLCSPAGMLSMGIIGGLISAWFNSSKVKQTFNKMNESYDEHREQGGTFIGSLTWAFMNTFFPGTTEYGKEHDLKKIFMGIAGNVFSAIMNFSLYGCITVGSALVMIAMFKGVSLLMDKSKWSNLARDVRTAANVVAAADNINENQMKLEEIEKNYKDQIEGLTEKTIIPVMEKEFGRYLEEYKNIDAKYAELRKVADDLFSSSNQLLAEIKSLPNPQVETVDQKKTQDTQEDEQQGQAVDPLADLVKQVQEKLSQWQSGYVNETVKSVNKAADDATTEVNKTVEDANRQVEQLEQQLTSGVNQALGNEQKAEQQPNQAPKPNLDSINVQGMFQHVSQLMDLLQQVLGTMEQTIDPSNGNIIYKMTINGNDPDNPIKSLNEVVTQFNQETDELVKQTQPPDIPSPQPIDPNLELPTVHVAEDKSAPQVVNAPILSPKQMGFENGQNKTAPGMPGVSGPQVQAPKDVGSIATPGVPNGQQGQQNPPRPDMDPQFSDENGYIPSVDPFFQVNSSLYRQKQLQKLLDDKGVNQWKGDSKVYYSEYSLNESIEKLQNFISSHQDKKYQKINEALTHEIKLMQDIISFANNTDNWVNIDKKGFYIDNFGVDASTDDGSFAELRNRFVDQHRSSEHGVQNFMGLGIFRQSVANDPNFKTYLQEIPSSDEKKQDDQEDNDKKEDPAETAEMEKQFDRFTTAVAAVNRASVQAGVKRAAQESQEEHKGPVTDSLN